MAKTLEIKITARETIKPSSPTPHHLRNYKLSILDQIMPVEYVQEILFYRLNDGCVDQDAEAAQISPRLKRSLSQTLSKFYPFAGVIRDHAFVECNDSGVEYVEARANCLLSDILHQPDQKLLREFFPIEIESPKACSGPLVLVQVTFFKCGGMAVGICQSHKMADAWTSCTFINSWAATARGSGNSVAPEFVIPYHFSPDDSVEPYAEPTEPNRVTKRFMFEASKVAALKDKVASANVPTPTRFEAVAALIWKCTMTASRSIRGFPRISLTIYPMNFRNVVSPPFTKNSMGNFIEDFAVHTSEREIKLQDLVSQLRQGKEAFRKNGLKTMLENRTTVTDLENQYRKEGMEIDCYECSDISRLPFYEADFGWGKPIWVSVPNFMDRTVVLMGTRDGKGIEALVNLREEYMALFERDPELLAFAALNPSVLTEVNGPVKLLSHL